MTTKKPLVELVAELVAQQTIVAADKELRTPLSVVVEELAALVKNGRETIASFAGRLQADPASSLAWADNVFIAAADLSVCSSYLEVIAICFDKGELSGGDILAKIRRIALVRTVDAARYPKRSTSPAANQMETENGAAQARVLQLIDNVTSHFDAK